MLHPFQATSDFWRARRRANFQQFFARLTGRETKLLQYDDVRRQLHARNMIERGLQEIPLDDIVGSVGRYQDFSRTFLPLQNSDRDRWSTVKTVQSNQGTPPIEVYKLGNGYFVIDGNHRVSVAREHGNATIEAYVTEVETRVPFSAEDDADAVFLKAEYANFLDQTELDRLRPKADLILTVPGKYPLLLEHIEVHRYFMGLDEDREVPYLEAVQHWYDTVYVPTIRLVRERGLLHDFPQRTSADLYVWLAEHRAELESQLGWDVQPELVADTLATKHLDEYKSAFNFSGILRSAASRPAPVPNNREWMRARLNARLENEGKLISVILLPMRSQDPDWHALEQAIVIAKRENSIIRGLFTVDEAQQLDSLAVQAIRAQFEHICADHEVDGELIVELGDLDVRSLRRSRWADLTVVRLQRGTSATYRQLLSSLGSPTLIVPEAVTELQSCLLVYDGSDGSRAALFAAEHVAAQWQIPLTVIATTPAACDEAKEQLNGLTGEIAFECLNVRARLRANAIQDAIAKHSASADLVIAGGEIYKRLIETSAIPVLLCQ